MSLVYDYRSYFLFFFFFKQKTAYEMRISDWSSDVCSSDLIREDEADLAPPFDKAATAPVAKPAEDKPTKAQQPPAPAERVKSAPAEQIGRASCRERVCQYV